MDGKKLGLMTFGELAEHYIAERKRVDQMKCTLYEQESGLSNVGREIVGRLQQGRYLGLAAGSMGIASAIGHAWWSGANGLEVYPLSTPAD